MVLSLRGSAATNGGENSSSLAQILELIDSMWAELRSMREDLRSLHLDSESKTQKSAKIDLKLESTKTDQESTTSNTSNYNMKGTKIVEAVEEGIHSGGAVTISGAPSDSNSSFNDLNSGMDAPSSDDDGDSRVGVDNSLSD